MTPSRISSSHLSAVSKVFKSVAARIFQRCPADLWDYSIGEKIVDNFVGRLRKMRDSLGDNSFGFELTQRNELGSAFTAQQIIEANRLDPVIIVLDKNLHVIGVKPLTCDVPQHPSEPEFSDASEGTVIGVYIHKNLLKFYSNGFTAGQISLDSPHNLPPKVKGYARSASDYELSILDHFQNRVKYWQGTTHWADRSKRVLHSQFGPMKTEDMFHNSLFLWLDLNLEGDVKSKARDINSDEPDIHITSIHGHKYIVEIKWLGTNGVTSHSIPQLKKAIGQLNVYLRKGGSIKRGSLVVYDGRIKTEFEQLGIGSSDEYGCVTLEKCESVTVDARGACMILFLESKTASQQ